MPNQSLKRKPTATESPSRRSEERSPALSQKAQLTRRRIKSGALYLLNTKGYRNVHITDITAQARVANGLFYRYFRDLPELTHELCEDLFREINQEAQSVPFDLHPFDWIYEVHLIAGKRFADNPGLLACMFELPGEFGEFGDVWTKSAHTWNLQIAKFLRTVGNLPAASAKELAFVLGAMAEGIYYQALIRHTKDLTDIGQSADVISDMIALVWYRTIFLENPPPSKIRSNIKLLKSSRSRSTA